MAKTIERVTWIEVILLLKLQSNRLFVKSVREKDEQMASIFRHRGDTLKYLASLIEAELPK